MKKKKPKINQDRGCRREKDIVEARGRTVKEVEEEEKDCGERKNIALITGH